MPDLGKKYECFNCHTKFYNLGKPEAICPKCGANQKNAKSDDAPRPGAPPAAPLGASGDDPRREPSGVW